MKMNYDDEWRRKNWRKQFKKKNKNWKIYKNGARTDAPKPSKNDARAGGAVSVVSLVSMDGPETTIKIVLAEQHKNNTPRTSNASEFENNSDHPHPPFFFAKDMPPKYAIQWGPVWHIKVG